MLAAATASWDGKVDADTADRRHGMGGIADRQQAGLRPVYQAVELDRQQMQIADLVQLGDVEFGRGCGDLVADHADALGAILLGGALRDEEGALPIGAAVDQHEQPPALDIAAQRALGRMLLADAEPEDVHRRAEIFERQHRADDRIAAVGGDHQPGRELAAICQLDRGRPALLFDEAGDRPFHLQPEAGKGLGLLPEEIEELPLRHHGDEWRRSVEV